RYTSFGPTAGCAGRPGHRPRSGVQDIPPLPMEPTALYFWIRPPPGGSAGPNGDPDPLPRCRRLLEPRPREALHPGGTPAPWLPSPLLRVRTPAPRAAAPGWGGPPRRFLRRRCLLEPGLRGVSRPGEAPGRGLSGSRVIARSAPE